MQWRHVLYHIQAPRSFHIFVVFAKGLVLHTLDVLLALPSPSPSPSSATSSHTLCLHPLPCPITSSLLFLHFGSPLLTHFASPLLSPPCPPWAPCSFPFPPPFPLCPPPPPPSPSSLPPCFLPLLSLPPSLICTVATWARVPSGRKPLPTMLFWDGFLGCSGCNRRWRRQ